MADNEQYSKGQELLDKTWFDVIEELRYLASVPDDHRVRIEAARTLLDYFKSFGQSLNQPWIPAERPGEEDPDEEDYDD